MTDQPTDGLEQRLRRDLDEIANAVPVSESPAPERVSVIPITAASGGQRSLLRAAGFVAAAAALLVGVLIWRSSDSPTGEDVRLQDPLSESADPPPPPGDAAVSVWLSETRVPASGADVMMILLGGPDGARYKAAYAVDRWNGSTWMDDRLPRTCLEWAGCASEPMPAEFSSTLGSIILGREQPGISGPLVVRLDDLDPGWYRVRFDASGAGEPAVGQFEVVAESMLVPDLVGVFDQGLRMTPPLIGTEGAEVDLLPRVATGESWADQESHFSAEADLRRWADGEWVDVVSLPVSPYVDFQRGEWASVELPALEPGYYQLVRDRDDGEPVVGPLWVSPQGGMTTSQATVAASTAPPPGPAQAGCPTLPALVGVTVRGETLGPADGSAPSPRSDSFGADEGGAESFAASETFRVAAALPVRPVIDLVGERTAQEGPVLLWWAAEGRVEAWVTVDGCERLGLSVEGGTRDQNATAAYDLALRLGVDAGATGVATPDPACPAPGVGPSIEVTLYLYCPADDVDQVPVRYPAQSPPSTPTEALQALFRTDPPPGWGTGVPLQMRGADVEVVVTDGVAQVVVDYDFEAAPINGFSTSSMSLAYGNQLQATLFQFPEIQAIDLDTLCCGEWGGLATRAD